jgi:hypothetical protein
VYIAELESIYNNSKNIIRNLKLKNLIEENTFKIREKITTLMISFIIESVCINQSIKSEELIAGMNLFKNKFEILISLIYLGKKEYQSLINILEDLSKCIKFELSISNEKLIIDYDINIEKKESGLKLTQQRKEEEIDLNHLDNFIPQSPRRRPSTLDS